MSHSELEPAQGSQHPYRTLLITYILVFLAQAIAYIMMPGSWLHLPVRWYAVATSFAVGQFAAFFFVGRYKGYYHKHYPGDTGPFPNEPPAGAWTNEELFVYGYVFPFGMLVVLFFVGAAVRVAEYLFHRVWVLLS